MAMEPVKIWNVQGNPLFLNFPQGLEALSCSQVVPDNGWGNFVRWGPEPKLEKYPELVPIQKEAKAVAREDAYGLGVDIQQTRNMQVYKLKKLDMESLPRCKTGWKGCSWGHDEYECPSPSNHSPPPLDPEVDEEVKYYVHQEGWHYIRNSRPAQVVADCRGRLAIIKCRRPDAIWVEGSLVAWNTVVGEVENAMQGLHQAVSEEPQPHSRGNYHFVSWGYSYGGGQESPQRMSVGGKALKKAVSTFKWNPYVCAYARTVAGMFRAWHPKLARLYSTAQLTIFMVDKLASMPFPCTQFSSCTANFSQESVTGWHVDEQNLVFGMCAVGAFGHFNHQRSAHLMFDHAQVIIEVARGDIVLFPSALFPHKNADLAKEDTRHSMVFYSSGALFRWIKQGYQVQWKEELTSPRDTEKQEERRWKQGLGFISNLRYLETNYSLHSL